MAAKLFIVEVMPPHRADQEGICQYKAFGSQRAAEAYALRIIYDAKAGRKTGYGCLIVEAERPAEDVPDDLPELFSQGRPLKWHPWL